MGNDFECNLGIKDEESMGRAEKEYFLECMKVIKQCIAYNRPFANIEFPSPVIHDGFSKSGDAFLRAQEEIITKVINRLSCCFIVTKSFESRYEVNLLMYMTGNN